MASYHITQLLLVYVCILYAYIYIYIYIYISLSKYTLMNYASADKYTYFIKMIKVDCLIIYYMILIISFQFCPNCYLWGEF